MWYSKFLTMQYASCDTYDDVDVFAELEHINTVMIVLIVFD